MTVPNDVPKYEHYERVPIPRFITGISTSSELAVCKDCGAIIGPYIKHEQLHTRWHAGIKPNPNRK